jgi:hypothetical protein
MTLFMYLTALHSVGGRLRLLVGMTGVAQSAFSYSLVGISACGTKCNTEAFSINGEDLQALHVRG